MSGIMTMSPDKDIPRLLGVGYLIQFVASLLSGPISDAATGSGDVSQKLVSISNNVMLIRISIIAETVTIYRDLHHSTRDIYQFQPS
jgi:hypothetical protein